MGQTLFENCCQVYWEKASFRPLQSKIASRVTCIVFSEQGIQASSEGKGPLLKMVQFISTKQLVASASWALF